MPRSKNVGSIGAGAGSSGSKRFSRGNSDTEFINLELDTEQTKAYRIWREDVETVVNHWTELVEAGYRVNTKYDDYSSSCAAFIIPPDGSENFGYILTGRGGNAYRALCEALFKDAEVLRNSWSQAVNRRKWEDDPDF